MDYSSSILISCQVVKISKCPFGWNLEFFSHYFVFLVRISLRLSLLVITIKQAEIKLLAITMKTRYFSRNIVSSMQHIVCSNPLCSINKM